MRPAVVTGAGRGLGAALTSHRVAEAGRNMLTIALAQEPAGRVRRRAVHPGGLTTAMAAAGSCTSADEAAVWPGNC
ncbi:hypothetical protein ACTI_65670 [Actinoplanes sp. OR16]|uniref:hypothetical protein n=1 Tax=Actinoplanes sp. OR16 TaxID=946334 RepID=UPI000F6B7387|nr:hypothetical protein [Actinoplanes sp. OR16]BBH69882.1 hypothetical protein ACTI_65670 [Actinoplanes sp. OR16]